ncbi:MAG: transposase [Pseudomonadota bacterium]|nr:transposase [Pseudomonadota bacterium]
MLSTIVFCEDWPAGRPGRDLAEVLARTLASLVTAKVEGLLCDVRIAGPAGKGLSLVANHAGCTLIEAENEADWLGLALQAARGPDVLLLCCGRAPEAGFIEEAGDFLAKNTKDKSRAARLRAAPESFLERVFPSLAVIAGLIASRDSMLRAPRGGFRKLARCIGPAATFQTRARRIG